MFPHLAGQLLQFGVSNGAAAAVGDQRCQQRDRAADDCGNNCFHLIAPLLPPSQHQHRYGKRICASKAAGGAVHKDAGIFVIALRDDLDVPAERRTGIAPDTFQRSEGSHAGLQGERVTHPLFQHGCGGILRRHVAPQQGKAGSIFDILPFAACPGFGHMVGNRISPDGQLPRHGKRSGDGSTRHRQKFPLQLCPEMSKSGLIEIGHSPASLLGNDSINISIADRIHRKGAAQIVPDGAVPGIIPAVALHVVHIAGHLPGGGQFVIGRHTAPIDVGICDVGLLGVGAGLAKGRQLGVVRGAHQARFRRAGIDIGGICGRGPGAVAAQELRLFSGGRGRYKTMRTCGGAGRALHVGIGRIRGRGPGTVAAQKLGLLAFCRLGYKTLCAVRRGGRTAHHAVSGVLIRAPDSSAVGAPAQDLPGGTAGRNVLIAAGGRVRVVIGICGDTCQLGLFSAGVVIGAQSLALYLIHLAREHSLELLPKIQQAVRIEIFCHGYNSLN
uniref:Uncharacterized protein n=1 Tax=virus sp. ctJLD79 TaxID=2827987 RepID=A0A8S5RED6_9VIRU|nr:MAG TPA: hypothetical protein [virus sp. ctJLD79]